VSDHLEIQRRAQHAGRLLRAGLPSLWVIVGILVALVGGSVLLTLLWGFKHLTWGATAALVIVVLAVLEGSYRESRKLVHPPGSSQRLLGVGGGPSNGRGGQGGNARAAGARSTAIGGHGGRGGVGGPGGDGGSGDVTGSDALVIGGHGGDAGQPGGLGGRGGRGPTDRFGTPSHMWGVGRGGRGGMSENNQLREVLSAVSREYSERFPDDAAYIDAGLEQVPIDWLNQRLVELGERWHVDGNDTYRTVRSLDQPVVDP
jgi:hypothetical protein